ncbi:MAG: hypothetical protein EOM05_01710 [Clostridia bacterium]|nr:hypothetical protein [Clostridia bacterium]
MSEFLQSLNTPIENTATDVLICGDGTVSTQTQKPSTISSVTLPNNTDLQNAVLTDADKTAVANGDNVNIQLIISSVQAPADSDKVQQSLGSNTLGMYLDISMLKTVGTTETSVHNLNAPIRITFTIPDNLKGKDTYCIIRVHDGVTTVLNDLDSDPNTVTFETDRFSTYALAYSNVVNTSDSSNIMALAFMTIASLGAVAFIEKKKVGNK